MKLIKINEWLRKVGLVLVIVFDDGNTRGPREPTRLRIERARTFNPKPRWPHDVTHAPSCRDR